MWGGKYVLSTLSLLLYLGSNTTVSAQETDTNEEQVSTQNVTTIEELTGININKSNYKDFISVGNGGSNSTVDGTANQRVFVIYNMGAKKFLTSGSYWGRHAALSDKPQLFWLQRRNETLSNHNQPLRYPTCEEDKIVLEGKETDFGTTFIDTDFSTMYLGSYENGDKYDTKNTRSYATYQSVGIYNKDKTEKVNLFDKLLDADKKTDTAKKISLGESNAYSPDGNVFITEGNALEGLNISEGEYLEVKLTLPKVSNGKNQNLLSIGPKIKDWFGNEKQGNIHIYYLLGDYSKKGKIEVDYTRADAKGAQVQQDQFVTTATFKLGDEVTITLNDMGIAVNTELLQPYKDGTFTKECPAKPTDGDTTSDTYKEYLSYMKTKAGNVIKFKCNENGSYFITKDENGNQLLTEDSGDDNQQIASTSQEWTANQKCYVYVDEDYNYQKFSESDNAKLFISQKIIKEDDARETVDKFLAFAHDPNHTIEGATGVYTDRGMNSYATGFAARNYGAWEFVPVNASKGVYKLALYMRNDTQGNSTNEEKKYYLTGMHTYVHGDGIDESGNVVSAKDYYYHQLGADGTWKHIEENSTTDANHEYTFVNLSENDDDDFSSWKIISLEEYDKLQNNTQAQLTEAADITYLMSDPGFARNSGGLKAWQVDKEGSLGDETDTSYKGAKLRIGLDGFYKTSPNGKYHHGLGCNYDPNDGKDLSSTTYNVFNSTHARYMCTTVQNGGHGKFYQNVSVYEKGWYILSCQGMSTVGAKLYIKCGDNTVYYPLTTLSQKDYTDKIVCADENNAYWPLDQNMPMYNAAVWMEDPYVQEGQTNLDKYQSQVAINVTALEKSTDGAKPTSYTNLEVGIYVPPTSDDTRAAGTTDFTAFDNFQLYYSGTDNQEDEAKTLLLSEEFTDLDYLDKAVKSETDNTPVTYENAELHLWRTFNAGYWNTLVLPVSLTSEQFHNAFDLKDEAGNTIEGKAAKLVKISKIMGNKLVFASETELSDGTFLKAYKPYLIWTAKAKGDAPKSYNSDLTYSKSTLVSVPKYHFVIKDVTLKPNAKDDSGNDCYDFLNQCALSFSDGTKWNYVVVNEGDSSDDDGKAYDQTDGKKNESRFATFYGTLCQTYDPDKTGDERYFSGTRPTLDDGKSYYMSSGSNFRLRKSKFGQKGFRCWFTYTDNNDDTYAGAKNYTLDIKGVSEDVTSIGSLLGEEEETTIGKYVDGIYNMSGQKVAAGNADESTLPAGIYIVRGKKVIIK